MISQQGSNSLTATPHLPSSTQIRKRQARDKQKDWPEKRHKTGNEAYLGHASHPSGSVIPGEPKVKMEDKKIIEVKPPMTMAPSSSTAPPIKSNSLSITPSPVEVRKLEPPSMQSGHSATQRQMAPPPHMSQRPPTSSAVGPPLHSSSGVTTSSGLPKIDIAAALSRDMQQHAHPPPPAPHHGDQLVLPPHPDSHSRSSEGADPHGDQSFGAAKAAAPRAEQFEDRLKTIIHSVLTGDEQKEAAAAAEPADDGEV